jgi:phosphoenolpyruvate phosphomutase
MILVSAGDSLSAKLIEQAGFDGVWVSGFEASARLGLADNGSITLTEMLNIAKPIVNATKLPVFVDCDTGYGNLKRTVREFEDIGAYAICIQDDVPHRKTNSLWGGKSPLLTKEEFGERLESVKNRKIKIIARTETIIRNNNMKDAKVRLEHYYKCFADIIMPHTRDEKYLLKEQLQEIGSGVTIPSAIVPTKFSHWTNKQLNALGYEYIIWANQTERTKIKAVRAMLASLEKYDCMVEADKNLCTTLDDMKGLMPDG